MRGLARARALLRVEGRVVGSFFHDPEENPLVILVPDPRTPGRRLWGHISCLIKLFQEANDRAAVHTKKGSDLGI